MISTNLLRKTLNSWATRSLAVGVVATVLDIGIGLLCIHGFGSSTRMAAMLGVAVGATFTFFANRVFAFRDHDPQLAAPALKFVLLTAASMVLHGQLVVWMTEGLHLPYVASKVIADVGVFSIGQLLLLRYLVFPQRKPSEQPPRARAPRTTASHRRADATS